MQFRRRHRVFRRHHFFHGHELHGSGVSDIGWFDISGAEMTDEQWSEGYAKSIGVFLNGDELPDPGPHGEQLTDDSFLMLFNGAENSMPFVLPADRWGERWATVIDTNDPLLDELDVEHKAGDEVEVEARSIVVLQRV